MKIEHLSGELLSEFNPFEDNYLLEILSATASAWNAMKQPASSEIEDRITFRIAGRLQNDPLFSELPYDVDVQRWRLSLEGELLGRIDLRFKHRSSHRDYFVFEAKRLHVTYPGGSKSTEYPTYVGEEGMTALIEGFYAEKAPAAGMLGYIMDGKSDKAWNGLSHSIEKKKLELKVAAGNQLETSAFFEKLTDMMKGTHLGETTHCLDNHHLRVFHLLLPVDPAGS